MKDARAKGLLMMTLMLPSWRRISCKERIKNLALAKLLLRKKRRIIVLLLRPNLKEKQFS